jgi:hypothetical protein
VEALPDKLRREGTLQILTDMSTDEPSFKNLSEVVQSVGFTECTNDGNHKIYFPSQLHDEDFSKDRVPMVILFCLAPPDKKQHKSPE